MKVGRYVSDTVKTSSEERSMMQVINRYLIEGSIY